MRIFIARASGVIGIRLVPLLTASRHVVAGVTRSPSKASLLRELGALPVVCNVLDADTLTQALTAFRPDLVLHQLARIHIDDAARQTPARTPRAARPDDHRRRQSHPQPLAWISACRMRHAACANLTAPGLQWGTDADTRGDCPG